VSKCENRISDSSFIKVEELVLGDGVVIDEKCFIKCKKLNIGDFTTIGPNCRIDVPELVIGDYSVIYNDCLFYGSKAIIIGHNFYLGGRSILNSYAPLTIGNGVGIGTQSQVWTHALWGEEMEGCMLTPIEPVSIEEGAWLVGHVVVGAGISIGKYSIILPASLLTKSTGPKTVWGGVPASEITHKFKGYKDVSLAQKFDYLKNQCYEFAKTSGACFSAITDSKKIVLERDTEKVIIYQEAFDQDWNNQSDSIWDINTKSYRKKKHDLEIELIKYLNIYKARFYPL